MRGAEIDVRVVASDIDPGVYLAICMRGVEVVDAVRSVRAGVFGERSGNDFERLRKLLNGLLI